MGTSKNLPDQWHSVEGPKGSMSPPNIFKNDTQIFSLNLKKKIDYSFKLFSSNFNLFRGSKFDSLSNNFLILIIKWSSILIIESQMSLEIFQTNQNDPLIIKLLSLFLIEI